MIEINLVPDVKQELIRAQRQRAAVISVSVIVSIAAAALVALLAAYVFGVQTVRSNLTDSSIDSEAEKLAQVEDLPNTLTIQNQLAKLPEFHAEVQAMSRLFDILSTIDPPAPNNMTISQVDLDTETTTILIEGYAQAGYSALEVFKKTIEATTIQSGNGDDAESIPLAEQVDISETSYGENSEGARVLRFVISFVYPPEVFARDTAATKIVAPTRENATDSYRRLPQSLFGEQAQDIKEEN